jgi:hypothetical protein
MFSHDGKTGFEEFHILPPVKNPTRRKKSQRLRHLSFDIAPRWMGRRKMVVEIHLMSTHKNSKHFLFNILK